MSAATAPRSVSGPLTYDSAPELFRRSAEWFGAGAEVTVDLGGVTRADSAGLALMVEWVRWARDARRALRFTNVPEQIRTLVRINGLQELIQQYAD